jgi:hypothetical protein
VGGDNMLQELKEFVQFKVENIFPQKYDSIKMNFDTHAYQAPYLVYLYDDSPKSESSQLPGQAENNDNSDKNLTMVEMSIMALKASYEVVSKDMNIFYTYSAASDFDIPMPHGMLFPTVVLVEPSPESRPYYHISPGKTCFGSFENEVVTNPS